MDKSFLGKEFNEEMFERLKKVEERYKINISFEGGEAESLVLDCPMFNKKIKIIDSIIVEDGNSAEFIVKKAKLEPKGL